MRFPPRPKDEVEAGVEAGLRDAGFRLQVVYRKGGAYDAAARDIYGKLALALGAATMPFAARADVGPVMAALSDYMASAKDRLLPPPNVEHAAHHVPLPRVRVAWPVHGRVAQVGGGEGSLGAQGEHVVFGPPDRAGAGRAGG